MGAVSCGTVDAVVKRGAVGRVEGERAVAGDCVEDPRRRHCDVCQLGCETDQEDE